MSFIYYGLFYRLAGTECRSTLEIICPCNETIVAQAVQDPYILLQRHPDVVFIMLNPGSSRPCGGHELGNITNLGEIDDDVRSDLVRALPDPTIEEAVEQVMSCKSFDHARVINLFDIREQDSEALEKRIRSDLGLGYRQRMPSTVDFNNYSIFSDERRCELRRRLNSGPRQMVVAAWSTSDALRKYFIKAYEILEKEGLEVHGWATREFYHPGRKTKGEWATYILDNWPTH